MHLMNTRAASVIPPATAPVLLPSLVSVRRLMMDSDAGIHMVNTISASVIPPVTAPVILPSLVSVRRLEI